MSAAIVIPLISAFFGAVASVISKEVVEKTGSTELTALTFLSMSFLLLPVMPYFFSMSNYMLAVPLIGLIVVLDALANLLYFKGLGMGEVSKASAFDSLAPLFTALLVPFLLPEQFGVGVFLTAIGITVSVYFIQTGHGVKEFLRHIRYKKNYLIILSAVIFGFTAIPVRMALNEFGFTNSVTLYWVRSIGIFLVIYLSLKPSIFKFQRKTYGIIGLKSVFVIISWVSLFYAISTFNLVFTYALAKTVPLFTLLIAWEELGEDITARKVFAILLIIAAITVSELV